MRFVKTQLGITTGILLIKVYFQIETLREVGHFNNMLAPYELTSENCCTFSLAVEIRSCSQLLTLNYLFKAC